jgi:hypothetical protein
MIKLKINKKVEFDAFTHSYFCGDKELIGVTTLMKKHGLSPNYSGIDAHVLNHAAARGTAIHHTLETYDNGLSVIQPVTVDDNEGGTLTLDTSAELKAYRELGLNVIASEYLVSDNETYASKIDKVIATEEENTVDLGDVKSTAKSHTSALEWQLSIYAYSFEHQNKGLKVRNLWEIRVRNKKAQKNLVRRLPDEWVAALIEAEKKGEIYHSPEGDVSLSSVLTSEEIASILLDEASIIGAEAVIKAAKERIEERRNRIYQYMLETGTKELTCDKGTYKFKAPSTRTTVDSKRLKAERPDIYEDYSSTTEVKGGVTFSMK